MLPEVEQLFVWMTFSQQFDLSDPSNLEELNDPKGDEGECWSCSCSCGDLHEINAIEYGNLERTPGKAVFTECKIYGRDKEGGGGLAKCIKMDNFEEMKLRMYLAQSRSLYGVFLILFRFPFIVFCSQVRSGIFGKGTPQ